MCTCLESNVIFARGLATRGTKSAHLIIFKQHTRTAKKDGVKQTPLLLSLAFLIVSLLVSWLQLQVPCLVVINKEGVIVIIASGLVGVESSHMEL